MAERVRATKLVCTLGPASVERVAELVGAGMDVARVNLSHGDRGEHDRTVRAVREAAEAAGRAVALLADLSGPKVRLGEVEGGSVRLQAGGRFVLHAGGGVGDGRGASVTYAGLAQDLEADDRVLLADGAVELRVAESGAKVVTEIVRGGTVRSRAGLNVPSERLRLPAVTEKDREDAAWALQAGVDLVAQSFVRRAKDVEELRAILGDDPPPVVAKIETGAAVADAEAILGTADAVILARGDLGVELALEEIPVIQRDLVARANRAGTPIVVATQMLESMTRAPVPTRAEVSDVATAVFEGADAILLSAETAVGEYPVEAARAAARIAEVTEEKGAAYLAVPGGSGTPSSDAHAVARAAAAVARWEQVVAVACFTRTGRTAALLSAARPRAPIYAFSADERVVRRLALRQGVIPFLSDLPGDTDAAIEMMDRRLRGLGAAGAGDAVVMVAAAPVGQAHTNLLKVHRLGL